MEANLAPADEGQDAAAEEISTANLPRPPGGRWAVPNLAVEGGSVKDSVLGPDVLPYRRMPAGVPERCETIEAHYGPVAQRIEQQPSKLKVAGSIPAGVAS